MFVDSDFMHAFFSESLLPKVFLWCEKGCYRRGSSQNPNLAVSKIEAQIWTSGLMNCITATVMLSLAHNGAAGVNIYGAYPDISKYTL